MPPTLPGSVDASNKFEDLSGVDITLYANPYDALIEACQDNSVCPTPILSLSPLLALQPKLYSLYLIIVWISSPKGFLTMCPERDSIPLWHTSYHP